MTKHEQTRRDLELALYRIQKGRPKNITAERKLSIASVAEETGVSASTIHNRYPDMAEHIRTLMGKDSGRQRNELKSRLDQSVETIRQLRSDIAGLERQIKALASENARLLTENRQLTSAVGNGKVVSLTTKKTGENDYV